MISLKNIKIAHKLTLGFGILVIFMFISSFIAVKSSIDLSKVTANIYNHPLAVSKAVRDIRYDVMQSYHLIEHLDENTTADEIKQISKNISDYKQNILNNFTILEDRFLGDMNPIKDAKKNFIEWNTIIEKRLTMAANGNLSLKGKKSLHNPYSEIEVLDKSVQYVINFANNKGDEFYRQAESYKVSVIAKMAIIFTIKIIASVIISLLITRSITKPLNQSVKVLSKLAKGDLNIKIENGRKDEMGLLQKSMQELKESLSEINEIAHQIAIGNLSVNATKRSDDDILIESLNDMIIQLNNIAEFANQVSSGNLGTKITKRSEHDKLAEYLNNMIANLSCSQDKVIKSEKMAMLGSLMSGVAHEINTPLAAIKSSGTVMKHCYGNLINKMPMINDLYHENKECFEILLPIINSSSSHEMSSREKREVVRELAVKITEYGEFKHPKIIAGLLVDNNLQSRLDDITIVLKSPKCLDILEYATIYSDIRKSISIINTALDKTTNIIDALKNYIYQQNTSEMIPTDLVKNIDSVLTLYHNKIKNLKELNIELNYSDLPKIKCLPGKLNQVWTNLINNSLYAMGDTGLLSISIEQDEEWAVVKISDTGSGIPQEIQEKIFEPLFTTKPIGDGTGLGLDICKKIIEEHHGEIAIESVLEHGTTFIIKLPFNQPEQAEKEQPEPAMA